MTPGPHRLLRAGVRRRPSASAGSVTPTTTRLARPRPSGSSPRGRAPSSSRQTPTARARAGRADEALRARLAGRPRHPPGGVPAVGEVEKLGPATLDLIRTWLQDSKATIQPVLDLNRTDDVDRHDPPAWMREQVILRDRHCVFPWCGRDARQPTSTTSSPTSHPTKADHRARRTPRTSHRCAGDITGPRPSPAGPTNAPATAPTSGPAPTAEPGPSDPTAPAGRVRPHPPTRRAAAYTLAT